MAILQVITKQVFEQHVPAARMPERNTSVFDHLSMAFKSVYYLLLANVIGQEFEQQVESDGDLKELCVRWVCLEGFARSCRSLDITLTATGFGIVSTESMAPASRQRVDSLIEEVSVDALMTKDKIIDKMRSVTGWGLTRHAFYNIRTLFYQPWQLVNTSMKLTTQNWQTALARAVTADAIVRNEISTELMEELLKHVRTNALNAAETIMADKIMAFFCDYMSQNEPPKPNRHILSLILQYLESNSTLFPAYEGSTLYAKRHAERYENKKDDPTYFFM